MLRRTLIGTALIALFALFSATRAKADEVITWTLPASPTPNSFGDGSFFEIDGVAVTGAPVSPETFDFYPDSQGGGLSMEDSGSTMFLNEFGPQLYTGPAGNEEGMPTFLLGTFTLTGEGVLSSGMVGTLDITSIPGDGDLFTYTLSSTPEPGSLLLLSTGLLSFIGLARKKISA
jgi:hypothetical protein